MLGLSDAQVATINHEQLGAPLPARLDREAIPRFPTPSSVINKLTKDSDKRKMLERLYPEYVFLCSFAHGLPTAMLFKTMFNKQSRASECFDENELKDTFHRQVEQPAYLTSLISLVQGAAELLVLYPASVELSAAVVKAWGELSKNSLLGKAIWNIRTRKLLGIVAVPKLQPGGNM